MGDEASKIASSFSAQYSSKSEAALESSSLSGTVEQALDRRLFLDALIMLSMHAHIHLVSRAKMY